MLKTLEVEFHRLVTFEVLFSGMSCCNELQLVEGDTGPLLNFILKDVNGNPINLTGKTVKFFLKMFCHPCHSNIGHENMCILDAVNGSAQYILQPGDVSAAGTYFSDVQIGTSGVSGCVSGWYYETAYDTCRFSVRENNKC